MKKVLDVVYHAMEEKGYNPVNQIVGYIMSGDPTYITSHKGARSLIMKVERDEVVGGTSEGVYQERVPGKRKSDEAYSGAGLRLKNSRRSP